MSLKTRAVVEGRRYSRRRLTVIDTPDGEAWIGEINPDDVLSTPRLKRDALGVLDAAGLDASARLVYMDDPYGSLLREYALNERDFAPDSREGLAAQIVEIALHVEALRASGDDPSRLASAAYRLGRLATLAAAYRADDEQRKTAAKAPRPERRDQLRADLVRALRGHRRAGRTLDEALAAMADEAHGLRVRRFGASYRITDESAPAARPLVRSRGTLETLWAEAGTRAAKASKPATSGR